MLSNASIPCYPAREAASNGVLQGDNPTHFALPLLIIQTCLVLVVTRAMALLFKPFRQPRVLAEIIGGVLLGPSGLGRNQAYLNVVFPKESLTLLDTIATLGLLFFLFMVGLELDLSEIRKSGKTALLIALSGIAVPFVAGIGVANLVQQSFSLGSNFAPLVVFMGVPISITAFPVLVRIMAERRILTTDLGKMVVPAAAINDVMAWILLAIGVALSAPSTSSATPVYVLMAGVSFVIFMLFVVKRGMEWIAHRAAGQQTVSEIYVCIAMVGVLISGFATDVIGIHPLFGAFMFGLIVPKEGTFAKMLIEKVEDFITVLMLPLFFASSGLKTNLGSINNARAFGLLMLLVLTAAVGKISATLAVALSLKLGFRESLAFGFLMNTKGLVELIVLNIGKDLGVFDEETFAILVLMCLLLMFLTTPAVMALYKPARSPVPYTNRRLEGSRHHKKDELRILACIHGTRGIPALLNLVEACRSTKKRSLKLFAMHLVELSGRTSTMLTLGRARTDGTEAASSNDNIFVAFETYGRLTKVPFKPLTVISDVADMHVDVCNAADDRRATILILPCNFQQREDGVLECVSQGFRHMNQRVLQHAPCSVGILVDKELWGSDVVTFESASPQNIAVVFFGGPDDREALVLGCRLAEHPNVKLYVLRLLPAKDLTNGLVSLNMDMSSCEIDSTRIVPSESIKDDHSLDEESLLSVKELKKDMQDKAFYEEHIYDNAIDATLSLVKSGEFSLALVGRGAHHSMVLCNGLPERQPEHSELGVIGDALVSSGEIRASVLVIQQHMLQRNLVIQKGVNDPQTADLNQDTGLPPKGATV